MGVKAEGPFPRLSLPSLDGHPRPLEALWSAGEALVLLGHGDCKTTRQTLPYVDRIHLGRAPGATVTAVLQDDAVTARALVADQRLELPVLLEADPYPLAAALDLVAVPTLFLLDRAGRIAKTVEGFSRSELESLATRLGVVPPLFGPEDRAPAFRPG